MHSHNISKRGTDLSDKWHDQSKEQEWNFEALRKKPDLTTSQQTNTQTHSVVEDEVRGDQREGREAHR